LVSSVGPTASSFVSVLKFALLVVEKRAMPRRGRGGFGPAPSVSSPFAMFAV
jgi:hypothetical protein